MLKIIKERNNGTNVIFDTNADEHMKYSCVGRGCIGNGNTIEKAEEAFDIAVETGKFSVTVK